MAYCRVLLCNTNKKSSCCNGGFLVISNKYLVTFHFLLAIYQLCTLPATFSGNKKYSPVDHSTELYVSTALAIYCMFHTIIT